MKKEKRQRQREKKTKKQKKEKEAEKKKNEHYKLPKKMTVGTGENQQTFQSGQNLFWRVRWDYFLICAVSVVVAVGACSGGRIVRWIRSR